MLKINSIAIALLILIQSFNIHLSDIVELDELIEHAQFHAKEYGDDFAFVLNKTALYPLEIAVLINSTSNYFYHASYHSLEQEGLFQPPRQA